MADLFSILKITVGSKKLTARVLVKPGAPLYTSEDIEATARVYYLAPGIAEHACLGDAGSKFQDCMAETEIAHLLEHLTCEIMIQTGLAGDVATGRTRGVDGDERLFDIELSCPDDVLTIGSLSSAVFMMQWAFLHADQTPPDFAGTVAALTALVQNLRGRSFGEEAPGTPAGADAAALADAALEDELDLEPAGSEPAGYEQPGLPIDTEGAVAVASEPGEGAVFGGAASA